jgi:hypothetical protein
MFFRRVLGGSFAPGLLFVNPYANCRRAQCDADLLDFLWRLDPSLFYPVAVRESLGIVESSRLKFELYRRAKPPGLGDGLLVRRHPERFPTFEAVVILKADSQAAVSVRFESRHFSFLR